MINTRTLLQLEIDSLKNMLYSVPKTKGGRCVGSLQARGGKRGFIYYFVRETSGSDGVKQNVERLGDGSSPRVRAIKRARFARELRKLLEVNINALRRALKTAQDFGFDDIIEKMPAAYRIEKDCYAGMLGGGREGPRLPDRCERNWMNAHYQKNPAEIIYPHTAITGEAVRSKSEVIIYDLLVKYGVPFRYECALLLRDFNGLETVRYPDFTILTADGRCIYWEHLGMLSDERYLSGNMSKLALYHRNGINPGESLILTSDDADGCISSEAIARIIENVILPLL